MVAPAAFFGVEKLNTNGHLRAAKHNGKSKENDGVACDGHVCWLLAVAGRVRCCRFQDRSCEEFMLARFFRCTAIFAAAAVLSVSPAIRAEEGMWTFDNPPLKQLAA